jgi:glycerate dehydrogenase
MEKSNHLVVLDGFTLNPGDLSWDELRALCPCEIHERTPPEEALKRAAEADLVLTNKVMLGADALRLLPRLRYIGVTATGVNVVDLEAARDRGIVVTNVPAYGTASVAQATFALLLELTHHVGHHATSVREGRWTGARDWCYWDYPLVELEGLTLGVAGLGKIGTAVARLGQAFGMKVIAATRDRGKSAGFRLVSVEELFSSSDVISLHVPLTPETRHLVNAERLALVKPTAFLLNTSRGPLVDEEALAAALNEGRLAGAGLDVLSTEPPRVGNPLLRAANCLITPHNAWASRAARRRLLGTVVGNVRAYLQGRPQNVVGTAP